MTQLAFVQIHLNSFSSFHFPHFIKMCWEMVDIKRAVFLMYVKLNGHVK